MMENSTPDGSEADVTQTHTSCPGDGTGGAEHQSTKGTMWWSWQLLFSSRGDFWWVRNTKIKIMGAILTPLWTERTWNRSCLALFFICCYYHCFLFLFLCFVFPIVCHVFCFCYCFQFCFVSVIFVDIPLFWVFPFRYWFSFPNKSDLGEIQLAAK